jgi:hypothetical protein
MKGPFTTISVPDDAAELQEAMGSKPKFWYRDQRLGWCLYKEARSGTGEDWAEKVASELAELLGLAHARIELATWRGTPGAMPTLLLRRHALQSW